MKNKETCETCGPHGLTVRKVNGVIHVEVPTDFLSARLGSTDSQVVEALRGADQMMRNEQFTLASTSAAAVIPGGGRRGVQLLAAAAIKGRTTVVRDHCPVGEARLLQHNDYYDADGNLIKTEEYYLTECEPVLDAQARLAKLKGE